MHQPAPFTHLIEESFEEAAFLWGRWEAELSSISRNLDEIWSWTEDRLGGALDGVRLASPPLLERMMAEALEDGNRFKLAALGQVLAGGTSAEAKTLLNAALENAQGAHLKSLIRGVQVATLNGSFAPIAKMLARKSPEHAAALARLKSFRRATLGEEMKIAFESDVPALQAEAMKAAGVLPSQYAAAWSDIGLKHDDPAVRQAAMESGIRQRVPNAWAATLSTARELKKPAAKLLRFVAMFGNAPDQQIVYSALGRPDLQRAAIWALGTIGTRDAAEHCLMAMKHAKLSRIAGEAYCAITGADLARDRLTQPEPDEPAPKFEDDDLDANLVPSAEDQWPLPELDLVKKHWASQQGRYTEGVRYVRGRPMGGDALIDAVETAPMLRRPDYLLELQVRTKGKYDVEARALRVVQKQMMSGGRTRVRQPEPA